MALDPSSRNRLGPAQLARFQGQTLFDRVARVVCGADCLPRQELYESWEIARRARRRLRGGRVVDLACGHGLVAHLMLLLDDTSPAAIAVDRAVPPSASKIAGAMSAEWPRLAGRVALVEASIDDVALSSDDLIVSSHACGALTDRILVRAVEARARVVVMPCCHDASTCDTGGLEGWVDPALAIDVTRGARLRAHGYRVHTQTIPEAITPKNRLLFGEP